MYKIRTTTAEESWRCDYALEKNSDNGFLPIFLHCVLVKIDLLILLKLSVIVQYVQALILKHVTEQ